MNLNYTPGVNQYTPELIRGSVCSNASTRLKANVFFGLLELLKVTCSHDSEEKLQQICI